MEELIVRLGPLAVLLGAAAEYDGTLIVAGVAAHLRLLGLGTALVCGAVGGLLGDSGWYAVGRMGGAAIRGRAAYRRVGPVVERLAGRIGPWQIVLARFVFGTRTATMIFWGMRGLPYPRFAALDLLGTSLGAACLVTAGFAASGTAERLLGEVKEVERWLLAAVAAAVVLVLALRAAGRRVGSRPPGDLGGRI